MRKRLKEYLDFLEAIDYKDLTVDNRSILMTNMLNQISFFQHERLIHLIVTVTIALLTVIFALGTLFWPEMAMYLVTGLLLALLFAYIRHYYYLENGVQKLYEYYDKSSINYLKDKS